MAHDIATINGQYTIKLIKLIPNESRRSGRLADAELHFDDGPLAGLKLVGFRVWERHGGLGRTRTVTFPARQFAVNGERRSFALLRPITEATTAERLRTCILEAYAATETASETP